MRCMGILLSPDVAKALCAGATAPCPQGAGGTPPEETAHLILRGATAAQVPPNPLFLSLRGSGTLLVPLGRVGSARETGANQHPGWLTLVAKMATRGVGTANMHVCMEV